MMDPFDIFRKKEGFQGIPRTPSTSLQAVRQGLLPKEYFIYRGTSVMPLYQLPFDLDELERVLARSDLDIQTKLLLKMIFTSMLSDPDQEIALFAAESINILEHQYTLAIKGLQEELSAENSEDALRGIMLSYYELALLNEQTRTIRDFYFKEALDFFILLEQKFQPATDDIICALRIHIALGNPKEARGLLMKTKDLFGEPMLFEMLLAETEYCARDYSRLQEHLQTIRTMTEKGAVSMPERLSREQELTWQHILATWTGGLQ